MLAEILCAVVGVGPQSAESAASRPATPRLTVRVVGGPPAQPPPPLREGDASRATDVHGGERLTAWIGASGVLTTEAVDGGRRETPLENGAGALVAIGADVDGDGRTEILAQFAEPPTLRAWGFDGAPRYVVDDARLAGARLAAVRDHDGDGRDEIAAVDGGGRTTWFAADAGPVAVMTFGAPIVRFVAADVDRDGRAEALCVDAEGRFQAFDAAGVVVARGAFGGPCGAPLVAAFEADPALPLLVAATGGALRATTADGRERFAAPVAGRVSDLQTAELTGAPPQEIVAVVARDDGATLTAWRPDGATCFEARLDAPPARFFTAAWDGGDRRLLVALPRKSAEIRVYDAAQPDAPPRTLDAGGEIRNVALAGRAGRRPPDVAVLLQSGALRIFATDGALRWERTAPDARYAGVRAVDLDADGVAEIMAWVDAGGALDVFDAGGTAVARVAPPPRFRGGEHQAGDFDGDRRREIVFLKEEAPKGGPKRTHVALFAAPFGAPLWQRTFDGGGRRTTTGDVDADGAADLALLFDDGRLVALGGDGVLRWTTSAPVPCETLRGVDLDRDGATELLTQHPGGVLRLWAPPPRDARAANRRRFEQALAAAERGDERAAEAGFLAAGTTWTTLDAFRLESLTDRLARAAETSAAARRALAALEARGR